MAAGARRRDRPLQRARAADLDDVVDPGAAGQRARVVLPFGPLAVVEGPPGAQRLRPLALRVARRDDDGARAVHDRELQREYRHPAGTEQQHGFARLDPPLLDQRVPRGKRGAGQGGGLAVVQPFRDRHDAVLGERDLLGEHAVERAAERAGHRVRRNPAVGPALEEAARHPVAGREARHARADRRDVAGPVGIRRARIGQVARRRRFDGEQVAVVDRRRAHAHQDLPRPRFGRGAVGEGEGVDAPVGDDFPGAHAALSRIGGGDGSTIIAARPPDGNGTACVLAGGPGIPRLRVSGGPGRFR